MWEREANTCRKPSANCHITLETVVRPNKSQPATLSIQSCSRTFGMAANLWPRGASAVAHLLENPIPSTWIANRLANIGNGWGIFGSAPAVLSLTARRRLQVRFSRGGKSNTSQKCVLSARSRSWKSGQQSFKGRTTASFVSFTFSSPSLFQAGVYFAAQQKQSVSSFPEGKIGQFRSFLVVNLQRNYNKSKI